MTAQFLSVDPLITVTGQPYAYTSDDPVNFADPMGTITCPSWLGGGCGVITDVQNAISGAAQDTAHWVSDNASTLSTIASGLATIAYIACAATAGTGCAVGAILSGVSAGLAGLNAYHACSSGKDCVSALVSAAITSAGALTGAALEARLTGAISMENQLMQDLALARAKGYGQAAINGLQALIGAAELAIRDLRCDQSS